MSRLLTIYAMRFAGCFIAIIATSLSHIRQAYATNSCFGDRSIALWSGDFISNAPVFVPTTLSGLKINGSSGTCTNYYCGGQKIYWHPKTARSTSSGTAYITGICVNSGILLTLGDVQRLNVQLSGLNSVSGLSIIDGTGSTYSGGLYLFQGSTGSGYISDYGQTVKDLGAGGSSYCSYSGNSSGGGFFPFTGFNNNELSSGCYSVTTTCSVIANSALAGTSGSHNLSDEWGYCCPKPNNNEIVYRSGSTQSSTDQSCYVPANRSFTDSNGDYQYTSNCFY